MGNSPSRRIIIRAPKIFSLIKNRNRTIAYVNGIFNKAKQGIFLQMDMSKVQYTDPLTVSLIISLMMDRRVEKIKSFKYIHVRTPDKNMNSFEVFEKCYFHDTVLLTGNANQNYFMSRMYSTVNQRYTGEIIKFAHSKGVRDAKTILNPILVEIFSNTNNHATPTDETVKIPWFISIMEKEDRLCFSVVDLGIGIYESLRSNSAICNLPKEEYNTIACMYGNEQSRYLSRTIPGGVYSSTKLNFRGKGLKEIYEKVNNSTTCLNFVIITNKAIIDVRNIEKIQLDSNESLSGTTFYWEMKK